MSGVAIARRQQLTLVAATFLIAICGLIYELLAGTVSSYLVGNSVYHFSVVIGLFMSAMGLGSYLSRFVPDARLHQAFVQLQLSVALIGGSSAALLFFAFAQLGSYQPLLWASCILTGSLIGLEIPLVLRILKGFRELRINVSDVLTADYLGALVAALAFPLVLVPQLGLVRSALLFGCLNALVAAYALHVLAVPERDRRGLQLFSALVLAALLGGLMLSGQFTAWIDARLYPGEILHKQRTAFQQLVVTREGGQLNLYLDGALQFSEIDEYRYHEALVHPVMGLAHAPRRVLILGGGDGLAAREVLRHGAVQQVTLVDLDPAVTRLFTDNELLRRLNRDSLRDQRVELHNADAWKFLEHYSGPRFDVAIIDLPDPHDLALSRLYSLSFYQLLWSRMAGDGLVVTQAASPLFTREAFWCIQRTLQDALRHPAMGSGDAPGMSLPYHVYVPSFGDWGFVLQGRTPVAEASPRWPPGLRFMEDRQWRAARQFAADTQPLPVETNDLQTHVLQRYYEAGWRRWER